MKNVVILKYVLLALLLAASDAVFAGELDLSNGELLDLLDRTLENRNEYGKQKQGRLTHLKEELATARDEEQIENEGNALMLTYNEAPGTDQWKAQVKLKSNISLDASKKGYMFGFKKCNSGWMIDKMLRQLVGPDETNVFWQKFKDNYITRKDVKYIARTGANTIRLPFHYKPFTNEDYMGMNNEGEGFARVESVVAWCRDNNLFLILDMQDAPGGQTGDNIDDSYGYPRLLDSEASQRQFCDIWRKIAARYKDEPVILGYELANEPIAPYFKNMAELNARLEPLYKRATKAIREVDDNHIILLGGAQWNGNFEPFTDWKFDDKIMYTCHRYGGEPTEAAIRGIIDFRDKTGLPMYMGEIGHNTEE